jgi:hypothetical protein
MLMLLNWFDVMRSSLGSLGSFLLLGLESREFSSLTGLFFSSAGRMK